MWVDIIYNVFNMWLKEIQLPLLILFIVVGDVEAARKIQTLEMFKENSGMQFVFQLYRRR